jgi:hypothetical protein
MKRYEAILNAAAVPRTAAELSLVASEAEAAIGNAHSTVMTPLMERLPIRVHWVSDGLIIVKADTAHSNLVGRKILEIAGRVPEDLQAACSKLVGGGTPGWVRYRSEYFLTVPSALAVLGGQVEGGVRLDTADPSGAQESDTLQAGAEPVEADVFQEWRQSQPGSQDQATKGWDSLLSPTQKLPLYQEDADKQLWLKDLPESNAVYVRIDGNFGTAAENAPAFSARALAAMSSRKYAVLDLRYDWGGDFTEFLGLVKKIPKTIPADGHIYLVTGPNTFSAGLMTATQVKRYAGSWLTIIGADAGDTLRFRAEGFAVRLPATGIQIYVPTSWDDVGKDCTLFGDCWPPDKFLLKGVGTLVPDIHVANDWAAYRDGRDLVMNAVLADMAKRAGEAKVH